MTEPQHSTRRGILTQVTPEVHVLDPSVGPDTAAVLGAMMSRAPKLAHKIDKVLRDVLASEGARVSAETRLVIDQIKALRPDIAGELDGMVQRIAEENGIFSFDFREPPQRIRSFLEDNVSGYGHASIADMAMAWLSVAGFGWPSAYLLEDFWAFAGQELSTRAVEANKIPGADGQPGTICRHAPESLATIHRDWLELYLKEKEKAGKGGWRFDDARVYLPGTVPTEVVMVGSVRNIARHLDHIRGLGGSFTGLADQAYSGLAHQAPVATASIGHKTRPAHSQWAYGVSHESVGKDQGPADGVRVQLWDDADNGRWSDLLSRVRHREKGGQHLDPLWSRGPRVKLSILCTVAALRDFHRHRPVMPWTFDVIVHPGTEQLALAPWYGLHERVPEALLAETSEAFFALYRRAEAGTPAPEHWEALHALPFGALVRLEAVCSLPAALYLLELRSQVSGANAEYKAQALAGLGQLAGALPREVVIAEHIDYFLEAR